MGSLACDGGACVPEKSCRTTPGSLRVAVSALWQNAHLADFFEHPRHGIWRTIARALCYPRIVLAQENPDMLLTGIYMPG